MWVEEHVTTALTKGFGWSYTFPTLAALTHLTRTEDERVLSRLRVPLGGLAGSRKIKGRFKLEIHEAFEGETRLKSKTVKKINF